MPSGESCVLQGGGSQSPALGGAPLNIYSVSNRYEGLALSSFPLDKTKVEQTFRPTKSPP